MAQPNNRRLASLLALLAVIAVLVMVFKLGKMSGSTGRSLKSSTGSASVRDSLLLSAHSLMHQLTIYPLGLQCCQN